MYGKSPTMPAVFTWLKGAVKIYVQNYLQAPAE